MATKQLIVHNVRLMFAKGLTERSTAKENPNAPHNGKKYNAKFAIAKSDPQMVTINKALEELATEAWKDKGLKHLETLRTDKAFVLRDGDKIGSEGFKDHWYFAPTNDKDQGEPQCIKFLPAHSNKDYITDIPTIKKIFYSGCRVNLILNVYTPKNGDVGIFGFIKAVQFWDNDVSLEGGDMDTSALPETAHQPVTSEAFPDGEFAFEGV